MAATPEARGRAKAFVRAIRAATVCATCGAQPIDWHFEGHRNHERVGSLAAQGASLARLTREIARCTPLCRTHHMLVDGRLGKLAMNGRQTLRTARWRTTGERHPSAVLPDTVVQTIRARYAAGGITQVALAAEYGVHRGWVSLVVSGRRR